MRAVHWAPSGAERGVEVHGPWSSASSRESLVSITPGPRSGKASHAHEHQAADWTQDGGLGSSLARPCANRAATNGLASCVPPRAHQAPLTSPVCPVDPSLVPSLPPSLSPHHPRSSPPVCSPPRSPHRYSSPSLGAPPSPTIRSSMVGWGGVSRIARGRPRRG